MRPAVLADAPNLKGLVTLQFKPHIVTISYMPVSLARFDVPSHCDIEVRC